MCDALGDDFSMSGVELGTAGLCDFGDWSWLRLRLIGGGGALQTTLARGSHGDEGAVAATCDLSAEANQT